MRVYRRILEYAVSLTTAALLLNTFFLQGVFAPIVVSSNSMVPAAYGPHWQIACPHCGQRVKIPQESFSPAISLYCQTCRRHLHEQAATLCGGDRIWVDRCTLAWRRPLRFEPLIFRCPRDAGTLCIKRVIGLPGEHIEINNGNLVIDGKLLETSLRAGTATPWNDSNAESGHDWSITLAEHDYLLLGDNAALSIDSRALQIGGVPKKHIIGLPIGIR